MKIIINGSSMVPIYQQIVDQIKELIINKKIVEGECLPSVRSLAGGLKISALTVKKAYDALDNDGYTVTVHGKGTYVKGTNQELLIEEQRKEIEDNLAATIKRAKNFGLKKEEIEEIVNLLVEEEYD